MKFYLIFGLIIILMQQHCQNAPQPEPIVKSNIMESNALSTASDFATHNYQGVSCMSGGCHEASGTAVKKWFIAGSVSSSLISPFAAVVGAAIRVYDNTGVTSVSIGILYSDQFGNFYSNDPRFDPSLITNSASLKVNVVSQSGSKDNPMVTTLDLNTMGDCNSCHYSGSTVAGVTGYIN